MDLIKKILPAMGKRGMTNPTGIIVGILVAVTVATALIPTIVTQIAGAENLTTTEVTILNLIPLFIVIALLVMVIKSTGVSK